MIFAAMDAKNAMVVVIAREGTETTYSFDALLEGDSDGQNHCPSLACKLLFASFPALIARSFKSIWIPVVHEPTLRDHAGVYTARLA